MSLFTLLIFHAFYFYLIFITFLLLSTTYTTTFSSGSELIIDEVNLYFSC